MSTSQPNSPGPEPGPAPIAMSAELADRLIAALEQIGAGSRGDGRGPDGPPVDRVRVRIARDYDVLRGLLGRSDAPRALRMRRVPNGGQRGGGGDNAVVFDDQLPLSASRAVVESPGDGSTGPLRETRDVDAATSRLLLTQIRSTMPISRVEIFDDHRSLVAFGPSAAPIA
jgi:hypothetical protein